MGNNISSLSTNTVVGWAVVLSVAAYVSIPRVLQQNAKATRPNVPRVKPQERQANQSKKENKAKRQRMETFANESKQSPPKTYASATSSVEAKATRDTTDDGVDNHAFAQQMARNKQSKFAPKTNNEQKQKSVKQSKAKAISKDAEADKVSAPSSTADADADDDDQSPVASPSVSAADVTGISDMLEKSASGPSVLRLTGTEEKQPQKPKKASSPQPTETKKQRQNRKKRDQEKIQREEDEKDRKVKLEAQRRIAREAEGRAAKDGSAFIAAQKASVWTDNAANGGSTQEAAPAVHQPLDTFDTTPKADIVTPPAKINGKENDKGSSKPNGVKGNWSDIPYSEEEQIAMLQKQETDWVPVKSRKAKKVSNPGVANSETSESANEAAVPTTTQPAPKTKSEVTNGRPKPQTMSTQSSFAALEDDGADLEEEHEWDV